MNKSPTSPVRVLRIRAPRGSIERVRVVAPAPGTAQFPQYHAASGPLPHLPVALPMYLLIEVLFQPVIAALCQDAAARWARPS